MAYDPHAPVDAAVCVVKMRTNRRDGEWVNNPVGSLPDELCALMVAGEWLKGCLNDGGYLHAVTPIIRGADEAARVVDLDFFVHYPPEHRYRDSTITVQYGPWPRGGTPEPLR